MKKMIIYALLIHLFASCSKLVEVDGPSTSMTSDNVYADNVTAAAVLTSIYTTISQHSLTTSGSLKGISLKAGLSADELKLYSTNPTLQRFYTNTLTNVTNETFWENSYSYLYTLNTAIEKLQNASKLTDSIRRHLLGEAYFLRSFLNFNLVNFFGDVPLVTSTDYRINAVMPRIAKDKVYELVESDLKKAEDLLSENFLAQDITTLTEERVRPTKWAATALLARVYLYMQKWSEAETKASIVINKTDIFELVELENVFLKNSKEAIFQLQPVNNGWNTEEARLFNLPASGPNNTSNPVYLSNGLLDNFPAGDIRKQKWIAKRSVGSKTYYYANKYKSSTNGNAVTEYAMVLRLAEMYLVRAEAQAQLNNLPIALQDINKIRSRAGLSDTTLSDKDAVLNEIFTQRRLELFNEWGHRWLDLKRSGRIDAAMNIAKLEKGSQWKSTMQLYPIPIYEINQNPYIIQNLDY
jgi:hypothetical protein